METKFQVVQEYKNVLYYKEVLKRVLGQECVILIGGSYSLQYHLKAFKDRPISDYDFVVTEGLDEAKEVLESLVTIGVAKRCSYYNTKAYYFGKVNGKKANILLSLDAYPSNKDRDFNSVASIARAKERYIKESWDYPRTKDIKDLMEIYKSIAFMKESTPRDLRGALHLAKKAGLMNEPVAAVLPALMHMAERVRRA